MSAQALAAATGLSIDTVRSIESGRTISPSFLTVVRMSRALGVSLDQLAEGVDERERISREHTI